MLQQRPVAVGLSAALSLGIAAWFGACTLADRTRSVVPDIVTHKVVSAHAMGSEACADCHDEAPAFYKRSYHRVSFFDKGTAAGCESCHGLGSVHSENREEDKEVDDIVSPADMRSMRAADRSALCLQCHQNDFPLWPTTDHALHQVSCWDCHASDLHKPPP
ncbi:MAG: hypothetical protein ACE5I7_08670, partial [Candidatus Binatia bacterium]